MYRSSEVMTSRVQSDVIVHLWLFMYVNLLFRPPFGAVGPLHTVNNKLWQTHNAECLNADNIGC